MCGVVITQDGVAQRGSEIAATLAPFNDDFGYVLEGLDHVFRFAHMHKSYWRGDDARRMSLAATDELAQFHQRRWRIAKGKQCIGMLLNSETDARLRARDA